MASTQPDRPAAPEAPAHDADVALDMHDWRWVFTRRALFLLWLPVLAVTAAHYTTEATHHWLHDIFRRLYYIPIVLGAFYFGVRGAMSVSVIASLVYLPHAFTHFFHQDPATSLEKLLEIVLYNVIAYITGMLAQRERRERLRQAAVARRLGETLEEKKLLEEQLIRAGRLQALGELTAGLAHEIRNPLASIKGAAEIISDEVAADSPRRKMVDIQKRELDRLSGLLERFLRFARPERFELSRVDLCEVADHVLSLAGAQARKVGVTVESLHPEAAVFVRGNRENLAQVVLNLVLNAVEACDSGNRVVLSCGAERRGRRTFGRLRVEDPGPGVPEALRETIFNPFVTTKDQGSGLGLAIAARIVDQHEGYLELLPAEGEFGGRFQVLVPTT